MSKFQSTISTVAALTTIFGAAVGGWRIAEQQREYNNQKQVIDNLQEKIADKEQPVIVTSPVQPVQQQVVAPAPAPVNLPPQQAVVPSPPPPPPPVESDQK
jgi:hypothetical protein